MDFEQAIDSTVLAMVYLSAAGGLLSGLIVFLMLVWKLPSVHDTLKARASSL